MANEYIHRNRLIKYSNSIYRMIGTGNPDEVASSQYKLMRMDPYLKMGSWVVKSPVLYTPYIIETPENQSETLSNEIKQFLETYLLKPYLYTLLYNALLGLDFGYSLQELIWVKKDGFWIYRTFIPADPQDVFRIKSDEWGGYDGAIVVNATGRVDVEPQYTWLWTHQYEYGNYFGTSIFKPAYQCWYDGHIVKINLLRHLEKRGSDLLFILFPDTHNADNTGFQFQQTAIDIADRLAYRKDIVIPNILDDEGNSLFKVENVSSTSEGEGYINAMAYCDRGKLLSLLIPPQLVVRDVGTGSYAEAVVKEGLLLSTINGIRESIESGLNEHVVNKLVKVNFGKDAEARVVLAPITSGTSDLIEKIIMGTISKGLMSKTVNEQISNKVSSLFPQVSKEVIDKNLSKDSEIDQEENIEDLEESEDENAVPE